MKKKVVAMFLAAVMAFSLVACGSKSDNGGSGDASGTETIKLGGVGPLTGGYANYGLSVQHGAELAVKEINAAGGVRRERQAAGAELPGLSGRPGERRGCLRQADGLGHERQSGRGAVR